MLQATPKSYQVSRPSSICCGQLSRQCTAPGHRHVCAISVCAHIYIYVCVYVCECVYVHIYTYTCVNGVAVAARESRV